MAVDMFIKLEGIDGESADDAHKNEVDVLAWSWGVSQSGSFHESSGGGAGKANFQDVSFTKWVDKASPNLMMYCATGKHIPKATLVCRKAGGEALEYMKIEMTKALVTSVSTGGSGGEDRLTENITLNFAEVDVKYQPQSATGGKEGGEITFGYNISTNKAK